MGVLQDDEYAVYNTNQQRVRYLVEFTASDDLPPIERVISEPEIIDVECSTTKSSQKGLCLLVFIVFSVLAKRLPGKSFSKMACFVSSGTIEHRIARCLLATLTAA